MSDNNDFFNRLAIGQKYEHKLVKIMNKNGIPARLNNSKFVKDIDIELYEDDIYIDSKLVQTYYKNSFKECGIHPKNCILINVSHVENYYLKEQETGKTVWIAFFIKFDTLNIKDLVFVPNSYLMYLINQVRNGMLNSNLLIKTHYSEKFRVDRSYCRSLNDFLNHIEQLRKIKTMK